MLWPLCGWPWLLSNYKGLQDTMCIDSHVTPLCHFTNGIWPKGWASNLSAWLQNVYCLFQLISIVYLLSKSYDLNRQAMVFRPNSLGLKRKKTILTSQLGKSAGLCNLIGHISCWLFVAWNNGWLSTMQQAILMFLKYLVLTQLPYLLTTTYKLFSVRQIFCNHLNKTIILYP